MRRCANCHRDLTNVSALRDFKRMDTLWCNPECRREMERKAGNPRLRKQITITVADGTRGMERGR